MAIQLPTIFPQPTLVSTSIPTSRIPPVSFLLLPLLASSCSIHSYH